MAAKIKPQLNDELDFKLLLHIVRKRLKIILPIFLIFFIISFFDMINSIFILASNISQC